MRKASDYYLMQIKQQYFLKTEQLLFPIEMEMESYFRKKNNSTRIFAFILCWYNKAYLIKLNKIKYKFFFWLKII